MQGSFIKYKNNEFHKNIDSLETILKKYFY